MSERYKTQVFDELCESHPEIAAGEDWRGYYVDWDEIVKAAALDGKPVWDESPIELIYQLHNKIEEQQAEIERLEPLADKAPEWEERARHFVEQSDRQRAEIELLQLFRSRVQTVLNEWSGTPSIVSRGMLAAAIYDAMHTTEEAGE